ncbi:MAG: LamG-like jellyroll fold domain-containing protein [Myxococcota bacterium]
MLALFACGADEEDDDALPPHRDLGCPPSSTLSVEVGTGLFAYYTRFDEIADEPRPITGPVTDVVVNVGGVGGQVVFSRETSYRPVWHAGGGRFEFPHMAESVEGVCSAEGRFDQQNEYAFARVLFATPDEVRIGWRYFPVLSRLAPEDVVHEVFTFHSDGTVRREHRPGTETITAWRDPLNRTVETYQLTQTGLEQTSTEPAQRSPEAPPLTGTPVLEPPAQVPMLHFRMDEGHGASTSAEDGTAASIAGQGAPWRGGISGTAFAFDGYRSVVESERSLPGAITVSGFLALGARPWNDAPLFESGDLLLGVGPYGRPILRVGDAVVVGDAPLALWSWTHLAGVLGDDEIVLLVDGERVGAAQPDQDAAGPGPRIRIGLNTTPSAASDGVRADDTDMFHHFSSVHGVEGLIDEVMVHAEALTDERVAALYEHQRSAANATPELQARRVPVTPGPAEAFGVSLEPLRYHDLWDDQWRVAEGDDVTVRFDSLPGSIVYWRGTVHGVNMVADRTAWMTDQSVEMVVPEDEPPILTLAEHMSDKQARRSHVRVIENTPARVVVHWRYATADVFDTPIHQTAFVDEMHTIYPNAEMVRHVFFQLAADEEGREFFHDFQVMLEPGLRPEDVIGLTALTYANLDGEVADLTWPLRAEATPPIDPSNIIRINFRSDWDVFGVAQGGRHFPSGGGGEISPYVQYDGMDFPFAGPWNHWPAAQIPSDGRYVTDYDRVSHFALGSSEPQEHGTGSMLYGFTNDPGMDGAVMAARAWIRPPVMENLSGAESMGYDTDARAYQLRHSGAPIRFVLAGSDKSPVHDPAFVVDDWQGGADVEVMLDGAAAAARVGLTRDRRGAPRLVVFVEHDGTSGVELEIR